MVNRFIRFEISAKFFPASKVLRRKIVYGFDVDKYLFKCYFLNFFFYFNLKESPEPVDAPGWRKLRSHAHHPEELLMREKALLFKDYIQPYNFASSELKTSQESVFGSTNCSSSNTNHISSANMNSSMSSNSMSALESSKYLQKRQYQLPQVKQSKIVAKHAHPVSSVPSSLLSGDGSAESSPETIHREPQQQHARSPYNSRTYQLGSMEWDPFIDAKNNANSKKGSKGISCRRKIVSPISEGDENVSAEKHGTSIEANDGSMFPERTPDISDTSSYVDSAPSTCNKNENSGQCTFRSTMTGSADEYSLTSGDVEGSSASSCSSSSSTSGRSKTNTESTITGWNTRISYDNDCDHQS